MPSELSLLLSPRSPLLPIWRQQQFILRSLHSSLFLLDRESHSLVSTVEVPRDEECFVSECAGRVRYDDSGVGRRRVEERYPLP